MFIYGLYDPRDGALRYVGQTTRSLKKRLQEHLRVSNRVKNTHLAHWVSSLWGKGLRPRIEVLATASSFSELDALEVRLIAVHRAAGAVLTNHTDGGGGQHGRVVSAETRAKISRAHKGRTRPDMFKPLTPETRAKISGTLAGRFTGQNNPVYKADATLTRILEGLRQGKPQHQVAKEMGISTSTLTNRLREARTQGIEIPRNYRGWNKGVQHAPGHLVAWYASRWGSLWPGSFSTKTGSTILRFRQAGSTTYACCSGLNPSSHNC